MDNNEQNNGNEINESNAAKRLRILGDDTPVDNTPTPKGSFFANYWYHYKWATIIGCFFLVVGIILAVQLITKEKTDLPVLYGGPAVLNEDEIASAVDALKSLPYGDGDDYNADLLRFCYTSPQKQEKNRQEAIAAGDSYIFNTSLNEQEYDALQDEIIAGKTVICFLDSDLYADIKEEGAFLTIDTVYGGSIPDSVKSLMYDDSAILLKDTKFARFNTVFTSLPEDTVIAVRSNTVIGGDRIPEKTFNCQLEYFKALLSFEFPEGYTETEAQ